MLDYRDISGKEIIRKKIVFKKSKRLIDLIVSFNLIIISFPLLLICCIFIKLEDGGPCFYSQVRTGLDGKTFTIYKLRSMRIDAEKGKAEWSKKCPELQVLENSEVLSYR